MKRLFVLMSCAVLLSACASRAPKAPTVSPVAVVKTPVLTDSNGNTIENIPFRAGISSVTVEKLAEAQGCTGGQGAGLLTPQGPVEVYRMLCDNRQVFTARCEMRQCRQLSMSQVGGYAVYQAPSDSNVVVAVVPTAPAPAASVSSAPVPAPQVPRLAFYWKCGDCVKNEQVPPMIAKAYEAEARKHGYAVSNAETANVSIVGFRQRGKDNLSAKIYFRDKVLIAEDDMAGMNGMSENIARKTFEQLRAAR